MVNSFLRSVTLEDKYNLEEEQIYLNGVQALVRLLLMQKRFDELKGLQTSGFISGYRGSPLGGFDLALWKAKKYLQEKAITFVPGINEDLAATAVWGTQQVSLSPKATVQGVFSMWYGKGPGVDRTGDVFKHANAAGTSSYGGVLALCGDDHACKSSTLPHQSDYAMMDAFIPVMVPSTVQEILDLGLYGWAMSRYTGLWVAFKVISDTVDTSASVKSSLKRFDLCYPEDFLKDVHLRWPDSPLEQEKRLHEVKLKAVPAFIRANDLNKVIFPKTAQTRIGIVTLGKAYLDTRQALEILGIEADAINKLGIALYKVVVSWPLEPEGILKFCRHLDKVIVIEEKRPLLETQIKDILYHLPAEQRPVVIGKTFETGEPFLPSVYEFNAYQLANALAKVFNPLSGFEQFTSLVNQEQPLLTRFPYYCSGCPHNTSTKQLPEGSRALAGIGCHYMATWIDPHTQTFTQMGGEGVPWIGIAPFTKEEHIFANLGDGTYFHSGLLAIRAALAAKVHITYKILYNDVVAMTGGQPVEGELTVAKLTQQLAAEGVKRIAVVSDDIKKYSLKFAPYTTFHHRSQLMAVQEDLKQWPGLSVLIYDQTCAAEKRRRRKRGLMEDPKERLFINDRICEGCGDCSKESNCLSVIPIDTEWGQKRAIDQSSCNKDYSCLNGFCPSFVSVIGGVIKKPHIDLFHSLPDPQQPSLEKPYSIFITGIGGTGIVTVGSLIGMAAHLESKGCSIIDMTGLAQKGGAVVSHIKIANKPEDIQATRVIKADLILGADIVITTAQDSLAKIDPSTRFIVNTHAHMTGSFTQDPHYFFPLEEMKKQLQAYGSPDFIDATKLATALLGDSMATNLFLVGYGLQKGWIPLSPQALFEAIRLNDVEVQMNCQAVQWGRLAAINLPLVKEEAQKNLKEDDDYYLSQTLEEMIERRKQFLISYQDENYAKKYLELVEKTQKQEQSLKLKGLTEIVAKVYFKLMAYKDEYEVARLYTDGRFLTKIQNQFEGKYKIVFHLASPLFVSKNSRTKRTFGAWILYVFKGLSCLKKLRGTKWDIFGYTKERCLERQMIEDYKNMIESSLDKLTFHNHSLICQLASVPFSIKGFGHVKMRNIIEAEKKLEQLKKKLEAKDQ